MEEGRENGRKNWGGESYVGMMIMSEKEGKD